MCKYDEDFKQAIENLQENRKSQKKRAYDVHYHTVGTEPQVLIRACIQGGSSGHNAEVYLTARGYKVIIPGSDVQRMFKKSELNLVIDCIKDFLENPLSTQ